MRACWRLTDEGFMPDRIFGRRAAAIGTLVALALLLGGVPSSNAQPAPPEPVAPEAATPQPTPPPPSTPPEPMAPQPTPTPPEPVGPQSTSAPGTSDKQIGPVVSVTASGGEVRAFGAR